MKPVLRIAAGLTVLVLVVLAALAAYLSLFFDANDYRERLSALVAERTGRQLTLSGELKLSVFPWLGFELGAAELGNAKGFSDRPFAALTAAEARVKLLPLLRQEVAIDRVVLKGLQLSLERRADGTTNWADLTGAPKDERPDRAGPGEGAGQAPAGLVVGGVDIQDAVVRWDDAVNDTRHALSDVDLTIGAVVPGQPFDIDLGASFSTNAPAMQGRFSMRGSATVDMAEKRYSLLGLRGALKANGEGVPGGAVDAALMADVAADLAQGTLSIKGLSLKAYELSLTGALEGTGLPEAMVLKGPVALDGFNPREVLARLKIEAPRTANPERLKRAALKGMLTLTPTRIALDDLAASLDDSKLTGRVEVADLSRRALRFELSLDALDADSYLPPAAANGAAPAPSAAGASKAPSAAAPGPAEGLRELDAVGRFQVGTLKLNGLQLSAIDVGLKAAGGRLDVTTKGALYGGGLDSRVRVDARPKTPQLDMSGGVRDVQIGPLLRDLTAKPERLSGRAQLAFDLTGAGLDAPSLKRTLSGTTTLTVLDGALKGVNIAQLLREAQARLTGKAADSASGPSQTDFSDLKATLRHGGGLVRNDDLLMRSPLLRVGGAGAADLVRETIDYRIDAAVVGTLTGQGGKSLDKLHGVTVPVLVSGSFAEPKYALDVEALLAQAAKGAVKEQVETVREKAKDRLKEELKKGLGGLLR
ncbi:AsmA family protein [Denitromonas iodatirespirans]|uniref:AsmA family protein n=1 Tax=Denitromonas iodatirespirans TaxID=2795389 RepID=A0A944DS52_DENI1|nr:AsmA family protein [Denitromonas iodatirespirans]MBT0963499.1 AsmA family protein [Denitromonas iodatirespirans]